MPAIPSRPPRLVAVAGNMGAGKSSLVDWLHKQYGMVPFFEPHAENPYLSDFYTDMRGYSLKSQLFFLVQRFKIHREIASSLRASESVIVQDRTIYEDAEIFATHLHRQNLMDARDWATYSDFYRTLAADIQPPDLMIYLRCPLKTLMRRIKGRGRDFEKSISQKYLASLEDLYEEWFAKYALSPVLTIETDRLDYVERLFDRLEVRQAIEQHLSIPPSV